MTTEKEIPIIIHNNAENTIEVRLEIILALVRKTAESPKSMSV